MNQSKLVAAKVALEKLAYPVEVHGTGVQPLDVDASFPAAKVLHKGDVVVAADGKPTLTDAALVDAIGAHQPGDTMSLVVERAGKKGKETVEAPVAKREGT